MDAAVKLKSVKRDPPPNKWINLTVSAMSRKSEVRIHHDRTHPSALTLPVIP